MKQPYSIVTALLMALSVITPAQDNATATPTAPAEPAQTEMQKWIATTDAQWQAVFKRDVSDVHVTELEKLKQQYVAALEAAVTKASSAGDLDGAVALRDEEKRFAGTNLFPEQDDAADAATIKQIRAAIRTQIARLDKDTVTRTRALHAKYDQMLAQAQTQLTQRQRLEDALLVKAKRDEITAAWITPAVAAGGQEPVAQGVKPPSPVNPLSGTKPKVPFGTKPVTEFVIEAFVDGNTTLHVTPQFMYWEVEKAWRVGQWQKADEATYVNGQAWMPEWLPDQGSLKKSKPTEVPFGTLDLEYRLQTITDKRGEKGLQRRTPTTAKIQNGEFVVDIPDKEGGAKWYKFLLKPKHR